MQNSNGVLNIILIGFHHRKGSVVELVYPSLYDKEQSEVHQLPRPWRHLPSLAIADGAHNYVRDCTYFTLPSTEKKDDTVFGVACYRQADSASYVQPNPEITRNTVQKSLVVLSRFPLFGFIAHHLTKITDSLFTKKGFTQESLRNSFGELSLLVENVLNDPVSYQDALFCNLNVSNFVRVYKRDALCLFKLLLLERRVLFTGDSGGIVSNWILTLLSLFPDLLRVGLSQCSVVDSSWISEFDSWPNGRSNNAQFDSVSQVNTTEQPPSFLQESVFQNDKMSSKNRDFNLINTNIFSVFLFNTFYIKEEEETLSVALLNTSCSDPISDKTSLPQKGSTTTVNPTHNLEIVKLMPATDTLQFEPKQPPLCHSDRSHPTTGASEKLTNTSLSEFSLYSPFPTDDWGFPLSLFTKSYLAPIYIPLGLLDMLLQQSSCLSTPNSNVASSVDNNNHRILTDRSVRGFIAGATNPLLRSNKNLTEVFVSSLSPVEGISDAYFPHLSELTCAFSKNSVNETDNDSLMNIVGSENNIKSVNSSYNDKSGKSLGSKSSNVSRPFSLFYTCSSCTTLQTFCSLGDSGWHRNPGGRIRPIWNSLIGYTFTSSEIDDNPLQDSNLAPIISNAKALFTRPLGKQEPPLVKQPKRSQPVIQINSENTSNKYSTNPRAMPIPLNRAIQLSRIDRLFIDHLISTVNMWFCAQTDYCQQLSYKMGKLITCNNTLHGLNSSNQLDEDVLQLLPPAQRTFLLRFPSQSILDAWIRQQFLIYLRALLLSAQGYNSSSSDFHPAYLTCLRSTRSFLLWRYQFSPGQLFSVSVPGPSPQNIVDNKSTREEEEEEEKGNQIISEDSESLQLKYSCTTSPDSVAAVVSQHPGRKLTDADDLNQITDGFKRLGNMAADQGRKIVSQSVAGLVKLGSEFNSTFRASSSSNFMWKFSDAFKSVMLNPLSANTSVILSPDGNPEDVNIKSDL
uniref:UDENN domain-containing protein n=1 Tax=Trichobilharzia regenti TaxID=157069 RepID=A0AA85JKW8_TRIRE|nr:unnamed protein product [Trichobilharzia regenti]